MERIVREWDYWAYLFRVTHRDSIPDIEAYDDALVEFIVAALRLKPGDELLDLACGSGVHGVKLGQKGVVVTGVDISPSLVAHGHELARQKGVEGVGFVVGDMREPPCAESFAAVTVLSQSFGFYGPEGDASVLRAIHTALRPGGRFLLDLNEAADLEKSGNSWQAVNDGFLLAAVSYDPTTCVRTSSYRYIDGDGRLNVAEEPERIRVYTLPELTGMITRVGLQVEAVYGRQALPLTRYGPDCRERRLVVGSRPQSHR